MLELKEDFSNFHLEEDIQQEREFQRSKGDDDDN